MHINSKENEIGLSLLLVAPFYIFINGPIIVQISQDT